MAATRAAIYCRVSSEEQVEGYSLDAQTRATREYVDAHGWQIVAEYRDEGRSARTDDIKKRPQFSAMLEDAEARLFDVLIVHKLDRFARNRTIAFSSLDRLSKLNVGFVSISENMDFATPMGQLTLTMFVGLAQFYSDNLSHETKKGKTERKRQGIYNGLLPFGAAKGEDGIPVRCSKNYDGLVLAFRASSEGKSDKEVADILTAAGYRTTGNRGGNPFHKDTVRRLLINRFFLGELPDGNGGWLSGKHAPLLDEELFDASQEARSRRQRSVVSVPNSGVRYSLSGLVKCSQCGGPMHIHREKSGRPRMYCYHGRQKQGCTQKSTWLDVYEDQIVDYLATFHIPEDYQRQIVGLYQSLDNVQEDMGSRRREIETRLERLKELYAWGDIERDAYQRQRAMLQAELKSLAPVQDRSAVYEDVAAFLRDLPAAWRFAGQAERHEMARLLFTEVVVQDNRVETVTSQPEFAPFFILDCQERGKMSNVRKRRGFVRHHPTRPSPDYASTPRELRLASI